MTANATPNRRDLGLAGAALLIGIGYDVLFYEKPVGISYLLFLCLCMVYLFRSLPGTFAKSDKIGVFLLVSVFLLSMTFALYTNPVLRLLNMAAVPFLAALYAEHAAGLHGMAPWGLQRMAAPIRRLLARGIASMPVALRIPARYLRHRSDASRFQTARKIVIGLLLSSPLVITAIALLSSADMLFQQTLQQIPDWFQNVPAGEILYRGLMIVIVGCYIFGLVWSLRQDTEKTSEPEDSHGTLAVEAQGLFGPHTQSFHASLNEVSESNWNLDDRKRKITLSLDPIITATVLVSINAVYVLFAVIQFAYLFGGAQGLLPDGMTYAEYARRGFGEVVLVALINFGLMLGTLYLTPVGEQLTRKLVRPLLGLLIANTAVLLVSAYVRLDLYEAAYGYTYTRFFVNAFLLWLGLMLMLMLAKIIRPQKALFRTAFVLTVAAYMLLNYVNIDAIIAERNIHRYQASGRIDWEYLNGLSYDAVPVLKNFTRAEGGVPQLAKGFDDKRERLRQETSWFSFNVAKYRAKRML